MTTLQVIFGIILPILTMGAGAAFMYVRMQGKIDEASTSLANAKKDFNDKLFKESAQHKSDKEKLEQQISRLKGDLDTALMWKKSFVELSNQTRWKRAINKDRKFGEWEYINKCTGPDGEHYVATDHELEEMRDRATKHPEDFA